jgi:iron(III) transport system ATP-binding protein
MAEMGTSGNRDSGLRVDRLTKRFAGRLAVDGLSLTVAPGEVVAVLGPSGCGKTTLLRCIAGLETIDEGEIEVAGRPASAADLHVPPERRGVGVVFQSYALWPHMSVAQNVAYPLRMMALDGAERRRRLAEALATVQLADLAERRPHELSGGQQQRVALARCLTQRAGVVLMDEPLANLDMHLREEMLDAFAPFRRAAGASIVYITHDQAEAMSIADRIGVMRAGRLLQVDRPEILYRRPANAAVVRLIGRSALLPATPADGGRTAVVAGAAVPLAGGAGPLLCIRPEDVRVDGGPLRALVRRAAYQGDRVLLRLELADGGELLAYADRRYATGETVGCSVLRGTLVAEE